jgi:hypothetical protein
MHAASRAVGAGRREDAVVIFLPLEFLLAAPVCTGVAAELLALLMGAPRLVVKRVDAAFCQKGFDVACV